MTESGRMSGETGQLQRLTDPQVSERLARLQSRRIARPRHPALLQGMCAGLRGCRSSRAVRTGARRTLCRHLCGKVDADMGPERSPNTAASIFTRTTRRCRNISPSATEIATRVVRGIDSSSSTAMRSSSQSCISAYLPAGPHRNRHHPRPGRAPRGDRGCRPARHARASSSSVASPSWFAQAPSSRRR